MGHKRGRRAPRKSRSSDEDQSDFRRRVQAEAPPADWPRLFAELTSSGATAPELEALIVTQGALARLGIMGDFMRALLRAAEDDK